MEHVSILCMGLVMWLSFTLALSAPAANESPSKEVVDAIIMGQDQDFNTKDEDVEALHSLATAEVNKTSAISTRVNKTSLEGNNHLHVGEAAGSSSAAAGAAGRGPTYTEGKRSSNMFYELSTTKDTPSDMAEYIFWTGDESGVTKTISDFVDQGLMSPEEGLTFLDEVKYFLEVLQVKYGTMSAAESLGEARQPGPVTVAPHTAKTAGKHLGTDLRTNLMKDNGFAVPAAAAVTGHAAEDSSATELKDRLELAEVLSNEFSLEEIIYQLARILFAQSLSQEGNVEAEDALQRFADFLEKDAKEGRLSPQLQKKVLEVLLMALFDALGEQSHSSAPNFKHLNLGFMKKPSILKNP